MKTCTEAIEPQHKIWLALLQATAGVTFFCQQKKN